MNIEKKEGGKAWRADWRTGVGGKNNQEDIKGGKTLCGVRVVRTEELEGGCQSAHFLEESQGIRISFVSSSTARSSKSICVLGERTKNTRVLPAGQLVTLLPEKCNKQSHPFSLFFVWNNNNVFPRVGLELKKSNNNIRRCISALLTFAFSPLFLLVHPPRDISCGPLPVSFVLSVCLHQISFFNDSMFERKEENQGRARSLRISLRGALMFFTSTRKMKIKVCCEAVHKYTLLVNDVRRPKDEEE